MKHKKIFLIGIILLTLLTISGVSAEDNAVNDSALEGMGDDVAGRIAIEDNHVIDENLQEAPEELSSGDGELGDMLKSNSLKDENSDFIQANESENKIRENFTIEFYDDYHIYGETNSFGFLMPKGIVNNVSIEIDGKSYDYEVYSINNLEQWVWGGDAQTQMGYMVNFSDLSIGDHEVAITYPGDDMYAESSMMRNITVHDGVDHNTGNESFSIRFYHDSFTYGETNLFGFLMPKDIAGNISVQLDWKNYDYESCDISNPDYWKWKGDAQTQCGYIVKFSDLKPGYHNLFITYPGDDKYAPSGLATFIVVDNKTDDAHKLISKLTVTDISAYYNAGKNLVVTLKNENGNPIKNAQIQIQINGKIKNMTTNGLGQIKLTTNNMIPKTYVATFTYGGNVSFAASAVKAKVTIKKAISKITAAKKTFKKTLKTKRYTITLKVNGNPIKNAKVTLKVNKKTYAAKTNSKGKATFKITKLTKKGTFKAIVNYAGSKCYSSKTVNTKIICK